MPMNNTVKPLRIAGWIFMILLSTGSLVAYSQFGEELPEWRYVEVGDVTGQYVANEVISVETTRGTFMIYGNWSTIKGDRAYLKIRNDDGVTFLCMVSFGKCPRIYGSGMKL